MSLAPWILAGLSLIAEGQGSVPSTGQELELPDLVARDARVVFTPDAARRARAALEAGLDSIEARAAAVVALGCGRAGGDLARIESVLQAGTPPEQRAALFALGELGIEGWAVLERALAGDTRGVEEALCFALSLAQSRGVMAAGERLAAVAAGEGSLARRAGQVRAHAAGESADEIQNTLHAYYELRWRAARAYGLIDGQRGSLAYARELSADRSFLARVVLGACDELAPAQLEPHLVELLCAGFEPEVLRATARCQPDLLARAHASGAWSPSSADWEAILDEIDAHGSEERARALLERAWRAAGELESCARALLFRSGIELAWSAVLEQLERADPERRVLWLEACGERGDPRCLPGLAEFHEQSRALGVFGPSLLALVRLGHAPAKAELEQLLAGPASLERAQVIEALARVVHGRGLRAQAERALKAPDLDYSQRLELQIALARIGALPDRSELRAALPMAAKHAQRLACARALAHAPEPADVETLAALFPAEDDPELNVVLAVALLQQRHPAMSGFLRAALWGEGWNTSVLAGGLIVRNGGLHALIDELALAPRSASERELRRVGFAIGEWGGLGAVEELARTRSEGDPALQGALLGALATRASEPAAGGGLAPGIRLEFPEVRPGSTLTGIPGSSPEPGAVEEQPDR